MSKSLTFQDVLIGIAIFAIEFLKVAALRFAFIIYAMFIALVCYPLLAGFIFNILIVTIPLVYFFLAIPALILGFCLALFMIIFREQFQRGGIAHIIFSTSLPVAVVGFVGYQLSQNRLDEALQVISSKSFDVIDGVVVFISVVSITSIIFAGGALGGLLQTKISKKLLAAPTSVRRQLMAYKNRTAN